MIRTEIVVMFMATSSIFRTILTTFITPDYTNMNINAFCADINIKNGRVIKKIIVIQ